MVTRLKYTMTRGELWDRLVIIKNRRTHRVIQVTEATCFVDLVTTKYQIPTSLSKEGGVTLSLLPGETLDIPVGTYNFDIVAPIRDYPEVVAKGTIAVSGAGNITPLEDAQLMEIRFKKNEDYRHTFAWYDSEGVLLAINDAYLQAKNTGGTTVLDLRWFASTPTENTVIVLPAIQRGYIAPYAGETLEIHISNANTIAAGEYPFDLFVKNTNGDWAFLSGGSVVVEASISTPPV